MKVFSSRLKWLREREKLTQADMAKEIGMSRPGYTKIEQGQREPNLDVLAKLPAILHESTDFMIGVTDFTNNAQRIYDQFIDASNSVATLKLDLELIQVDPSHREINLKDFNPNDPESVKSKIQRIQKNLPLWEERMEIARNKLLNMLNEIPCVREEVIHEIKTDNGWVSIIFESQKDPQ